MEPLDYTNGFGRRHEAYETHEDSDQEWNETSRVGLWVLGTGTALAFVADFLLRVHPWGLNVVLATLALLAGILWVRRVDSQPTTPAHCMLFYLALVFASFVAWRAAIPLKVINCSAAIFLMILASSWSNITDRPLIRAGIKEFLAVGFYATAYTILGVFFRLLPGIRWHLLPQRFEMERSKPILTGFGLAVPLLVIFGGLFTAADAKFELLVNRLFGFGDAPSWFLHHGWYIAVMTWVIAGFLCTVARSLLERLDLRSNGGGLSLGLAEVLIPLVALEALFFCFVLLQVPHFFGGHSLVQAVGGPTYSEYARRGFFELLVVIILALPLLLEGERIVLDVGRNKSAFRLACWPMVGLLLVVMASAFHRMSLYINTYGLTQQRFYATVLMMTLGVITLWLGATVLRGHRQWFAAGVIVCGFGCAAVLNIVNPDAVIARTNLDREGATARVDTDYIMRLSPDAIPAILEKAPALKEGLYARFYQKHGFHMQDWRTWNFGVLRAGKMLTE